MGEYIFKKLIYTGTIVCSQPTPAINFSRFPSVTAYVLRAPRLATYRCPVRTTTAGQCTRVARSWITPAKIDKLATQVTTQPANDCQPWQKFLEGYQMFILFLILAWIPGILVSCSPDMVSASRYRQYTRSCAQGSPQWLDQLLKE